MLLNSVSPESLAGVARLYRTNKDAGAAIGLTMRGFSRACRRNGIETPAANASASAKWPAADLFSTNPPESASAMS